MPPGETGRSSHGVDRGPARRADTPTKIQTSQTRSKIFLRFVEPATAGARCSLLGVFLPGKQHGGIMRVRLLGPVDVMVDDTVRPVNGLRRKAILAILGLYA